MTGRRGFTLVELLVSMVLLVIVAGGIYRLLNATQRISRAQAERVDMQSNMRAGALILPAELRAVAYDTNPGAIGNTDVPDILKAYPDSIQFRAIRGTGVICQFTSSSITISTGTTAPYPRVRDLLATDSLLIFVDNNAATGDDDRWVARGIASILPSSTACPSGWQWGTTGITVNLANANWTASIIFGTNSTPSPDVVDPSNLTPTTVTVGSPVKFFEVMTYGSYQDAAGKTWLGARRGNIQGAAQEPILGPLAPNGFRLTYYDATGSQITGTTQPDRSRIRTIHVATVAVSDQNVSSSGASAPRQVIDSVVTTVALRNALGR